MLLRENIDLYVFALTFQILKGQRVPLYVNWIFFVMDMRSSSVKEQEMEEQQQRDCFSF